MQTMLVFINVFRARRMELHRRHLIAQQLFFDKAHLIPIGISVLSDTEMCSRFIVLPSLTYSCTELITVSSLPVAGHTISSGCIPSFSSALLFSSLMLFI